MTTFTETLHDGGFLVSEANGTRSREQITVEGGQGVLVAGTVLGQIADNEKYVALDPDATDGSADAAAILYGQVDTGSGGTAADIQAVAIVRDAEVNNSELTWPDNDSNAESDGIVALAALGIICLNV